MLQMTLRVLYTKLAREVLKRQNEDYALKSEVDAFVSMMLKQTSANYSSNAFNFESDSKLGLTAEQADKTLKIPKFLLFQFTPATTEESQDSNRFSMLHRSYSLSAVCSLEQLENSLICSFGWFGSQSGTINIPLIDAEIMQYEHIEGRGIVWEKPMYEASLIDVRAGREMENTFRCRNDLTLYLRVYVGKYGAQDVTVCEIPTGDCISFKIESELYPTKGRHDRLSWQPIAYDIWGERKPYQADCMRTINFGEPDEDEDDDLDEEAKKFEWYTP